MASRDIAIAGCGIGGLAAALLLHRDGHRVTMFDRFDAPQPVGSGLMLQPTGLAVLRSLGLDRSICRLGAQIERLTGHAADTGRCVLNVEYGRMAGGRLGLGVHRSALFGVLYDAVVDAGVVIETGRWVASTNPCADGQRSIFFEDGRSTRPFNLVVDALGARSPLSQGRERPLAYGALWASLPWPQSGFDAAALQQRYRRASVMIGVMPTGRRPGEKYEEAAFFWSLRADQLSRWRDSGLDAWKKEVAAIWPNTASLLDSVETQDQLSFAQYRHRTLAKPVERGLIHIGDAWHATSPQLGQGANMALLDAFALALAFRDTDTVADALKNTILRRRQHIRLYQLLSLWLTPVYQSDGHAVPWLRDRLVGPLSSVWPIPQIQAHMVAGLIGNPLAALGLMNAS